LANGFSLNAKLLVWEVENLEDVQPLSLGHIDVCSINRRLYPPCVGTRSVFYDAAKGKYFLHFSIQADGVYD
jgi:hypothetical protein